VGDQEKLEYHNKTTGRNELRLLWQVMEVFQLCKGVLVGEVQLISEVHELKDKYCYFIELVK
jgi:hypothetical protein